MVDGAAPLPLVYEQAGRLHFRPVAGPSVWVSDFLKRELGFLPYRTFLSGKNILHPCSRAVFSKSGLGFTATACRDISSIS